MHESTSIFLHNREKKTNSEIMENLSAASCSPSFSECIWRISQLSDAYRLNNQFLTVFAVKLGEIMRPRRFDSPLRSASYGV